MKRPISGGRTRVVYGTRAMTTKQLAKHLQGRCTRELPGYGNSPSSAESSRERGVRYAVSYIDHDSFPGFSLFTISEDRMNPDNWSTKWSRTWPVTITATPELDVIVSDTFNQLDSESLRKVEKMILSCATRGPDR
jgi:hypothetical protein